jgi:hypothetical protein
MGWIGGGDEAEEDQYELDMTAEYERQLSEGRTLPAILKDSSLSLSVPLCSFID